LGETDQLFLVLLGRWLGRYEICPYVCAPALWYWLGLFSASGDLLRDVQGTIAGSVFFQVGIAVITGADDVQVFLPDSFSQAAWAGRVAVPFLVGQKPFHQVKDELDVRVEVVARRFPLALQPFI